MSENQLFSNAGSNVTVVFPATIEEILVLPMAVVATQVLVLGDAPITHNQWDAILALFDHVFLHGETMRNLAVCHRGVTYIESIRNIEAVVMQYCVQKTATDLVLSVHEPLEKLILGM